MIKLTQSISLIFLITIGTNPLLAQCEGGDNEMYGYRHPKEIAHFPGCEKLKDYHKNNMVIASTMHPQLPYNKN